MVNVLYGIYVYRMYLPCDVNKMNDKKIVLMCHWTVCLSITVYVLLFCPFKKKRRLYSKAVLTQHSLPHSNPAFFRAVSFITGALRQNLAGVVQRG